MKIPVYPKFKKASQALEAARALIRSEKRWTQNMLAIKLVNAGKWDEEWVNCSAKSKDAQAFCALGAVKRVNGPAEKSATAFLREAALKITKNGSEPLDDGVFEVNDEMGHSDTLKMFTLAIRAAKKAGK